VILDQLRLGPLLNFTYLVSDRPGGEAVVIDPSYGLEPLFEAIDRRSVKVRYVLNTHRHTDHTAGNAEVVQRTGAKLAAHRLVPFPTDVALDEGSVVETGGLRVDVLYTPGHTPDSVLYRFAGHLATGDTLFVGECGRVDLEGGDPSQMYDSLIGRISRLDDSLVVLPGHDYGETPTSTVGREKRENYTLKPRTREEFLAFLRS
jgi:hydroxyacylglutathione hydrolase